MANITSAKDTTSRLAAGKNSGHILISSALKPEPLSDCHVLKTDTDIIYLYMQIQSHWPGYFCLLDIPMPKEGGSLLGYSAAWSRESISTFQTCILLPS
jgi:hypothetical protein